MQATLRCRCGQAHGTVDIAPQAGMHLVCYCADCRAFAHALGRADILDQAGGSDVFIARPANVRLTSGLDQLRCLRLSEKGMLRWYWNCCNTPLANTQAAAGVPAISLHRACMDVGDAALPPPTYVNARSARGPVPAQAEQTTSLATLVRIVGFVLGGLLRGAGKPNPLFADGKPVCTPRVLSAAERDALREPAIA